ncbi:hypothetical protein Tco_1402407 [Tanacetum coccineum]
MHRCAKRFNSTEFLNHRNLHSGEMDLFSLIRNPNPFKVKTRTRPRATHEVPLLTATVSRVIDIEDPIVASGSSGTPSTVERSSLDFDNEDPTPLLAEGARAEEHIQEGLAHEIPPMETASTKEVIQEAVHEEEVAATEPPVNKRHHASGPAHITRRGKSLAAMGLDAGSTFAPPAAQNTPTAVSDPEPMSYAKPQPHPVQDIAQSPKGAAAEIPTEDVATTEVHGLRNRTQNLETLLEAEVDIKKVAEAKSVDLAGELESLRPQFSDLQVNNHQLSQQVSTLQAQVIGEERIKATFEEFKKSKDEKVEQRCVEMDARLDALSIDFDEELYPHMLKAIADRRWVIGHGLRLAIMKCAEIRKTEADVCWSVSAGYCEGLSKWDQSANLEKTRAEWLSARLRSLTLPSLKIPSTPKGAQSERSMLRFPRGDAAGGCHRGQQKPSDGIPVLVPTVAPQGLAILLADAVIQTEASKDEASPWLLRSKSLPPISAFYFRAVRVTGGMVRFLVGDAAVAREGLYFPSLKLPVCFFITSLLDWEVYRGEKLVMIFKLFTTNPMDMGLSVELLTVASETISSGRYTK